MVQAKEFLQERPNFIPFPDDVRLPEDPDYGAFCVLAIAHQLQHIWRRKDYADELLSLLMLIKNPLDTIKFGLAVKQSDETNTPIPEEYKDWFQQLPHKISAGDLAHMFPASVDRQCIRYRPHDTGFHKALNELLTAGSKMRICKKPDCSNPYYIASWHLQQFCGNECGDWGRNKRNNENYHRHSAKYNQTRREKRRKSHGKRTKA